MITYLCGLHILFIPIRWTLHHCITAQLACWILGVALSAEDRIRIVPDTVLCGLTGSSTMHSSVLVLTSPSGPRSLASVVISCESHILMYSHVFSYILIIYSHFLKSHKFLPLDSTLRICEFHKCKTGPFTSRSEHKTQQPAPRCTWQLQRRDMGKYSSESNLGKCNLKPCAFCR